MRQIIKKSHPKIKKFLVPHRSNNFHPHIFRFEAFVFIFGFAILLLSISFNNFVFFKKTVLGANIAANVLIDLANKDRILNEIEPLVKNDKLELAAQMKMQDMFDKNYFAHNSPDGTTPWYFIVEAGYDFLYAGENLAINFNNSNEVQEAWMNSPTHRANLLNSKFKEIGIHSKLGTQNNLPSVYVVQMFGTPVKGFGKEKSPIQEITNRNNVAKLQPDKKNETVLNKESIIQNKNESKINNTEVIAESKNFISVKNINYVESEDQGKIAGVFTYSSWLDRVRFQVNNYIQFILFFILGILIFAFGIRVFIEYKRQHVKHLFYSALFLLSIISICLINLFFINL